MPRLLANPDRLFHRTWRPRHPLRPRLSLFRRWGMRLLLLVLLTLILGYVYLPNSKLGRGLAAGALSQLLGGRVDIQHAEFSFFDGLRLDGVSLRVDDGDGPQSTLFAAKTFLVRIDPASLLLGRLQVTQIIAIEPTVTLAEDVATHQWNYQLLQRPAAATSRPGAGMHLEDFPVLPQVAVRGGQVRYLEIHHGQARPAGWFGLEVPLSADRQTLHAQLYNLRFGPDLKAVLPTDPSAWLEEHGLDGKIDDLDIAFTPKLGPGAANSKVRVSVRNIDLAISPDKWRSARQIANQRWLQDQVTLALAQGWISPAWAAQLRDWGTPQPIHLHELSGAFAFDDKSVTISGLSGRVENNWLTVDGRIDNYNSRVPPPLHLDIASLPGRDLEIPAWSSRFVGALPNSVRDICDQFQPRGNLAVHLTLERTTPGGPLDVAGRMDLVHGGITFDDFPYPLRELRGAITIAKGSDGKDYVHILDVSGYGVAGSANADTKVTVSGDIGPVDEVAGGAVIIGGKNVSSDPPLRQAMPPEVNAALELFDPAGHGDWPQFNGDFVTKLHRRAGHRGRWDLEVDLDLHQATGTLVSFPYPVQNLAGRVEVHDGYLDIPQVRMQRNGMSAEISGRVNWQTSRGTAAPRDATGKPMLGPQLTITAHHVPLDDDLLATLPPATARGLQQVGAMALLDVRAKVMPGGMDIADPDQPQVIAAPAKPQQDVNYLVDITLTDGMVFPRGPSLVLNRFGGKLRLTPDALKFTDITAHRGDTEITANGAIDLSSQRPRLHLRGAATNLAMDDGLYHALPDSARAGWDAMQPHGTLDASLKLDTTLNADEAAATQPSPPAPPADFALMLTPRDLTITPAPLPYRLDQLQGTVTFSPGLVRLQHLLGHHGQATVAYDGLGHVDGSGQWNLQIAGHNLDVDDDLRHAVPQAIAEVLNQSKLTGPVDIDMSQLAYRPSTRPSAAAHADEADVDLAATITLHGNALEVGVPMSDVDGAIELAAILRGGKLSRLAGKINVPKMQAASRPITAFTADVAAAADDPAFRITNLDAALADGRLTGDLALTYPDTGPSRYDINLVCHDVDIRQILNTTEDKVHGRLTASLTVGGPWNDVKNRRGHGDVRVTGEQMYSVPLMLGAFRWINMGVPSGFTTATARYNVDGQTLNFERLELGSKDMTMSGTGTVDFAAKRVDLMMVTDNPALLSVPVFGPLINPAINELMHIHVRGSIQQPKVSATSFDTVTTTVDEVLRKEDKK